MLKRIASRLVLTLKPRKMLEVLTTSEAAAAVKQETDDKTVMKRQHDDDNTDDNNKTPSKLLKKAETNIPIRTDRKRKVALLMAYSGEGYYGIQVNSHFPTIESELFKALVTVGLVPQDHVDNPYKMSFQRAARTDKGVSAIGQVVSLKMLINVENLIDRLNENLPTQIRILGLVRATNSFNSKNHCSHRTYIYIMPTFALTPVEENVVLDYRIDESKLEKLNKVLSLFKGTHNFHNFTSGRKFSDPSANRYIMEFETGKPVIIDGLELVTIKIQGQSFMLHHIRKMIGLSIAIVRGFCGTDVIDLSWKAEKVDVPKAPGLGLVLERLHYNGYNKRFGNDGIHESLVWDKYDEQMAKFKEEFIMKNIVEKEKEEKSMFNWLVTLHNHTFGYVDEEGERQPTATCVAQMNLKKAAKESLNSGPAEASENSATTGDVTDTTTTTTNTATTMDHTATTADTTTTTTTTTDTATDTDVALATTTTTSTMDTTSTTTTTTSTTSDDDEVVKKVAELSQ